MRSDDPPVGVPVASDLLWLTSPPSRMRSGSTDECGVQNSRNPRNNAQHMTRTVALDLHLYGWSCDLIESFHSRYLHIAPSKRHNAYDICRQGRALQRAWARVRLDLVSTKKEDF